jgi:Tfp pilus assembly pilus retraction ATPase PilT
MTLNIKNSAKRVLSLTAVVWLCGCANVSNFEKNTAQQMADRKPLMDQAKTVRTVERSVARGRMIDDVDARDAVNINVSNANFFDLLRQLSNRRGYGITAVQNVNVQRQITIDLRGQTIEQAMRQIAWQAGYAVVINKAERSVTVSDQATMVFIVPSEDLKRTLRSDFKFGGSAIGASGAGGSSSGSSGSMSGSSGSSGTSINPISATFTVTGEYNNNPAGFKTFLESLAGKNSQIDIFAESGLVSVRGNGQALKRVNDFLSKYDYSARRQIEINARLVEVALTDSFKYGIQWDKVMNADATSKLSINTLGTVGTDTTSSLSFTTASITSVVQALEQFTSVDVVSTPKLIVTNNSSGVFFKGTQVPYLPSVTSSTLPSGTGKGPVDKRFEWLETDHAEFGEIASRYAFRMILTRRSESQPNHVEVVLRILDQQADTAELDQLGLDEGTLHYLRLVKDMGTGLMLVTGPTGSGKTTTLYAVLNEIDPVERWVKSIENPIEYQRGLWMQLQTMQAMADGAESSEAKSASILLKGMLRAAPNVILFGEIRKGDIALELIDAANTGHLAFTTFHVNDAGLALSRLKSFGLDMSAVASLLRGVLAQRLVRTLCIHCAVPDDRITTLDALNNLEYIKSETMRPMRPVGCPNCDRTGFRGRRMVYELLQVTPAVRDLIEQDAPPSRIAAIGIKPDNTLYANALKLVAKGMTSIEEARALSSFVAV